jgi:hypothetical protein
MDDRPFDAGLVVIDLPARLVVVDGSYFAAASSGTIRYHDGAKCSPIPVQYELSAEWLFLDKGLDWRPTAEARRRERGARPPCDVREIVYGTPLLEFVASECFAVFPRREAIAQAVRAQWAEARRTRRADGDSAPGPDDDDSDDSPVPRELPDRERFTSPFYDTLKEIHVRWLMTPREDLGGKFPREVLLADHERRMRDMQFRCDQWTRMDECPRGLDPNSHAYRFQGFGTHEWVMYYQMVRELLWSSWNQLHERNQSPQECRRPSALTVGDFLAAEIPRLERHREEWLDTPDEEFGDRTPRSIIERERMRIPEAVSGADAMVDPDCPCCQMLAELPGPMFWNLDGCNMDEEFAFDIYFTDRDEWDQHQDYLNSIAKHNDDDETDEATETEGLVSSDEVPGESGDEGNTVWSRSYSQDDGPDTPIGIQLFGIGCHLAELLEDLREAGEDSSVGKELNRDFGNLREVLGAAGRAETPSLVDPVITRMQDLLDNIAASHSDLDRKCCDLSNKLARFLMP